MKKNHQNCLKIMTSPPPNQASGAATVWVSRPLNVQKLHFDFEIGDDESHKAVK